MKHIQPRQPFRVLVIYDNAKAGYRGFSLFLKLEAKFSDDFLFENHLCPISQLSQAEAADEAYYEAANADMLLVAVDTETELTPAFKEWAENLPGCDGHETRLLVALAEQNGQISGYLRSLAASKGMDFISNMEAGDYRRGTSSIGDWAEKTLTPIGSSVEPESLLESCADWGWEQFPVKMSHALAHS